MGQNNKDLVDDGLHNELFLELAYDDADQGSILPQQAAPSESRSTITVTCRAWLTLDVHQRSLSMLDVCIANMDIGYHYPRCVFPCAVILTICSILSIVTVNPQWRSLFVGRQVLLVFDDSQLLPHLLVYFWLKHEHYRDLL